MTAVAYFVGGPLDLSKQVFTEAPGIIRHAVISPMVMSELRHSRPDERVPVVIYRRRGRLEDQDGREVFIYEVMQ